MSDENKTEWSNVKSLHNDRFIETKKPNFDMENLHPEAQKRLQMLGLITIKPDGEQQERCGQGYANPRQIVRAQRRRRYRPTRLSAHILPPHPIVTPAQSRGHLNSSLPEDPMHRHLRLRQRRLPQQLPQIQINRRCNRSQRQIVDRVLKRVFQIAPNLIQR